MRLYARRMGRPALGPKIEARLSAEMIARIDALVGDRGRPAFIREAVTRELARQERLARRSPDSSR